MNERLQDFELLQADLSQVLPIYGELLGRKRNSVPYHPLIPP